MDTFTADRAALQTQAAALAGMMAGDTDARRMYDRARDLARTGLPLCLDPMPLRVDLERNIARLSAAIRTQVRMALRRDWTYQPIRHRQLLDLVRAERALLETLDREMAV